METQGTSEQARVVRHQAPASPVSAGLPKSSQGLKGTCSEVPQPILMKLKDFFNKFGLTSIRLSSTGAQIEIKFDEVDKDAAWELYIEMLTRITTQPLPNDHGDEKAALTSLYNLFPTTREILRRKGRKTIQFTKIAIPVLNQIVRPFTAKWHRESLTGAFDDNNRCYIFRQELEDLQKQLRNYNNMLAHIAEVEDLTNLEENAN